MAETPSSSRSHFFVVTENTPVPAPLPVHVESTSPESPSRPPAVSTKTPLFFDDSDDDLALSDKNRAQLLSPQGNLVETEVDLNLPVSEPHRASSVSSTNSERVHIPSSSRASSVSMDGPPSKKRKFDQKSPEQSTTPFTTAFLGSFLVARAWSTVRGKGYTKIGDSVLVERDNLDDDPPRKNAGAKAKNPKETKTKGGKRQISIATMLKPPPLKFVKKKKDTVVRLTNMAGFGAHVPLFHSLPA